MFNGSIVALVTPMKNNGEIDMSALEQLIDWHLAEGTHGIFVVGTTGEAPTLSLDEQLMVIRHTVNQVAERIPVIAGTGSNCTKSTIEYTTKAMEAGADACLLVVPYYNKPTQHGLFEHFNAVAKAVPIPLILYNIPGRTVVDLLPETISRLADIPNIVALKECSGVERAKQLLQLCLHKLDIFTGNDDDAFETMKLGYKGVISVTANVAPKLMSEFCNAMLNGQFDAGEKYFQKLKPLHLQLFAETNPIPVKWALSEMSMMSSGIRLPLTPLSDKFHAGLKEAMKNAGIKSLTAA